MTDYQRVQELRDQQERPRWAWISGLLSAGAAGGARTTQGHLEASHQPGPAADQLAIDQSAHASTAQPLAIEYSSPEDASLVGAAARTQPLAIEYSSSEDASMVEAAARNQTVAHHPSHSVKDTHDKGGVSDWNLVVLSATWIGNGKFSLHRRAFKDQTGLSIELSLTSESRSGDCRSSLSGVVSIMQLSGHRCVHGKFRRQRFLHARLNAEHDEGGKELVVQ
jgi:hypothetical protein